MAFNRANPAGWVKGELLTSTQINQIDVNQSLAVDGTGGGIYTPAAPIAIGNAGVVVTGSGLSAAPCTLLQMTGPTRYAGPQATVSQRVDRTTIDWNGGAQPTVNIDVSSDIYMAASALAGGDQQVGLNIGQPGLEGAVDGCRIMVRKFPDPVADTNRMVFFQDIAGGVAIGFLPGISLSTFNSRYLWAEFIYNAAGGVWEVLSAHPDFVG